MFVNVLTFHLYVSFSDHISIYTFLTTRNGNIFEYKIIHIIYRSF